MKDILPLDHPRVAEIEYDDTVELDVHATGGEHAMKESGSWDVFLGYLERTGGSLPEGIEDPFEHYLFSPQGGFCRAYAAQGGKMLAGFAYSTTTDKGLSVDALYAPDVRQLATLDQNERDIHSMTATALRGMIERNIIGLYFGQYQQPARRYLDFPINNIRNILQPDPEYPFQQNLGILRSLADIAITIEDRFRIPLPHIVIGEFRDISEKELEEIKAPMPDDFDGVVCYSMYESPRTSHEDFYRQGKFIGSLLIESPEAFEAPTIAASTASGSEVELLSPSQDHIEEGVVKRVKFLKALAENDREIAEMLG